ncbi:MAG: hypothetical protein CEE38_20185 [Planctomycetes bacterium B3_Pla]|nr:MAG: hypothetical protein CEE38_20185 [Planctomycetes bacterium B3_Pla]
MDAASELLRLAEEKFGKLTEAEEKLLRAAANGEIADYSPRSKKPIDLANVAKWGPSRFLLADRIAWLCTDRQATQLVTHRGIVVKGARIDEEFNLLFAKVPFPLYFELCKFTADINFQHAQIPALYMPGTHTASLSAGGLKTDGPIYLRDGFQAEGEICLLSAMIGGDLDCSKAQFSNPDGITLTADGLKVEGAVFLRDGFKAEGEVRLIGAKVGGSVVCDNSQFINEGASALTADRLKVGGGVFLRNGFKAQGAVYLIGATIGGDLDCTMGQFVNKSGRALFADGLKVDGHVFLRNNFKAEGLVSLVAVVIHGHFGLANVDSPGEMTLDLRSAKIGALDDDQESWPESGQLFLHGLEYNEISNEPPGGSKTRINWLKLQDGFWPQPYEQLAKVLRNNGDDVGVRDVLIAKNRDKARRIKLAWWQWFWYRLVGPLIGYGHRPWLAIPLALVIILFGWVCFGVGYWSGLITPPSKTAYTTTEKLPVPDPGNPNLGISTAYPVFNSLVYSIDVFVPVVDLRQARYWLPNANRGHKLVGIGPWPLHWGGVLLFWLWIETALGWILTTLFLVGLTGLVRT